ncbi:hypothetical protein ACROYT_G010696 [Oculina patagonica]
MMRHHISRRMGAAVSHRMQNGGLLRLLCSRKYFRLLFLFTLIVFIALITSVIIENEFFMDEFHENNLAELKPGQIQSLKTTLANNIFVERTLGQIHSLKNTLANIKGKSKINQTASSIESHQHANFESTKRCLSWCNKANTGGHYFLSAVLLVRIYSSDLAKLSTREMMQWLYYLKYAGFEHVYVYDAYVFRNESQKSSLDFLIKEDFVTYVDWSHKAYPYSVTRTQESAYQHCFKKWGHHSKWQASIDIDEYPFCPQDTKPNFMQRFIANFSKQRPDVSQITMQNFLFLGKPLSDKQHPLLVDRLKRRTPRPSNALVKPIYKPSHVAHSGVHHHHLRNGISVNADKNTIRLNHYWGARLQNWGEDTPEILAKTMEDHSMQEIIENLQSCDRVCLPNKSIINTFRWN